MRGEYGFVYGLFCPLDKELRYIGSTIDHEKRFMFHRSKSCGGHCTEYDNWKKELIKLGMVKKIQMEILESNIPSGLLKAVEYKFINQFLLLGCNLINRSIRKYRIDNHIKDFISFCNTYGTQDMLNEGLKKIKIPTT